MTEPEAGGCGSPEAEGILSLGDSRRDLREPGEVRSGWPRRGLAAARAFQAEARKQGAGGDSGRTAKQSSLPRPLEDRSRSAPKMRLRWWAGPGSRAFRRPGWELSPGGDREPWRAVVRSGRRRVPSGALWVGGWVQGEDARAGAGTLRTKRRGWGRECEDAGAPGD